MYFLSLVGIYIGVHDLLGVQSKPKYVLSNLCFLIQSRYSTSPRSHNGSDADGETREEFEGKPADTPHSRNGRRITESWLEWKPMRLLKQAIALCVVCRCSLEHGWWSRGRGSRAKNVVVDVESG